MTTHDYSPLKPHDYSPLPPNNYSPPQNMEKSECCNEPVDVVTTLRGENPLRCRACKKPCRIRGAQNVENDLIDDVIHDLEALDFNGPAAREVVARALAAAEARGREQIIRDVFSLKMSDPFGYGNSKVEVHDLEKIAEKYGYDKEAIIKLLLPLS